MRDVKQKPGKLVGAILPYEIIERLHLEAALSRRRLQTIVATALDTYLPEATPERRREVERIEATR
jgi:hypothetical protein